MKNDRFYQSLVVKMHEVSVVPPQSVGPFTPVYKRLVPQFKSYPIKAILLLSIFTSLLLYFVFGTSLVRLASILQFGF